MSVSIAKTVRVPQIEDPEKTAYELTAADGEVKIRKVSTAGKVACSLEDLEKAVTLLK